MSYVGTTSLWSGPMVAMGTGGSYGGEVDVILGEGQGRSMWYSVRGKIKSQSEVDGIFILVVGSTIVQCVSVWCS